MDNINDDDEELTEDELRRFKESLERNDELMKKLAKV